MCNVWRYFDSIFSNHWIGQCDAIERPPRSPDLTLGYFLWGYLKGRVYSNRPENIKDVEDRIRMAVIVSTIDLEHVKYTR